MTDNRRFRSRNTGSDQGAYALPELYSLYRTELIIFVRKRVGAGPPEPEDIAQQAFANFAGIEDPSRVQNPRAFLYRTAANLLADYRKSGHHHRSVDVDDADLEDLWQEHDEISPEIVLLDRERFNEVAAVIRALPRRQRRFLLLNRLNGMSYTEIAHRNGVSITTARREVEAAIGLCRQAVSRMIDEHE